MKGNESFLIPLQEAGLRAGWVNRIPQVDTNVERDEAISRLTPYHQEAVSLLGGSLESFWLCEQVHGNTVIAVTGDSNEGKVKSADGLATNDPQATLGIYVADCGAVYMADPIKKAIALIHSGRVGTEQNIVGSGIDLMESEYGSTPSDLIVTLAPCIRPPAYEVDFASIIKDQALAKGVKIENYHDCGICTTSAPEEYYSYRNENGKTGRMIALLGL